LAPRLPHSFPTRRSSDLWSSVHGPLGAKIPMVRRYVQCHVRPAAYRDGRQPPYDGVAEVWFDSTAAMRESATTPEFRAVRADEPDRKSTRLNSSHVAISY